MIRVTGWLTPDNAPTGDECITITIPAGDEWTTIVRGALAALVDPSMYQQHGTYTPEETALVFAQRLPDIVDTQPCQ